MIRNRQGRPQRRGILSSKYPIPGTRLILLWAGMILFLFSPVAWAESQLDLVLDVKSKFSDGCLSIQNMVELAQRRNIQGLVVADHERVSLEYGLPPLERIFKKKESGPSVLENGASTYLAEIRQVNEAFPQVLVIPGVESAPYYYWTGSPFDGDLVAHNWDKHLLVVGLNAPAEYEQLPTLNSNASWAYYDRFLWPFAAYLAGGVVCLVFFLRKKRPRLSLVGMGLFFLFAFNVHPLRSSPFDAYHGDAGTAPYQETIDYATGRGALTFWNHLESPTANGDKTAGSMKLSTPVHPEDLLLTEGYTGFQVMDDAPVPAAEPGKEWDQLLLQYVDGQRKHPVWGYGANDYHCEDQDNHKLGAVRTVVSVEKNDIQSVLDALRSGRMYAVTQPAEDSHLALDRFAVADGVTEKFAEAGSGLVTTDFPEVSLEVRSTGGKETTATVSIIRSGRVVKRESVALPYKANWRDLEVDLEKPVFYRVAVESPGGGRLLSNPVFVKFQSATSEENQVASVPQKEKGGSPGVTEPRPPVVSEPQEPIAPVAKPSSMQSAPTAPSQPSMTQPQIKEPAAPKVEPPVMAPPSPAGTSTLLVRLKSLAIRKGPGGKFDEVMTAQRDEPLEVVRTTTVVLNGKPWVEVKKDGKTGYVWSGFLKETG